MVESSVFVKFLKNLGKVTTKNNPLPIFYIT